jgi:glycosyltransferase involved in cell wall biosynthesis
MTAAEAMAKPTVSVALCTFNGEQFLEEQLESLRRQLYPISELVVYDDNSTDSTLLILEDFRAACGFPVLIHRNARNVGVVENFERAIACCTGELIALADQDDIWRPDKLKIVVEAFVQAPACGYVFSNAELVDEAGLSLGTTLWQSVRFDAKRQTQYAAGRQTQTMLRGGNFVYGTTLVFRSRFCVEILPIESTSLACTHDTWIGLYMSATGRSGIAVPQSLVQYRQHASQLFGGGKRMNAVEKIKHAITARPDIDEKQIDALMALARRVLENPHHAPDSDDAGFALQQMALHLRARYLASTRGRTARLGILFRELLSGRYGKYSSSSLSMLKDLLLPMRGLANDTIRMT